MHRHGSCQHEDRNEVELTDLLNDFRKSMLFCLVHENVLASLIVMESILPSQDLRNRESRQDSKVEAQFREVVGP